MHLDLAQLAESVIVAIRQSFSAEPMPHPEGLTGHRCEECDRVASGLRGKHWAEVGGEFILDNPFALGLLTPEAHRCYLPAFLIQALRPGCEDCIDPIVYDLCPGDPATWVERFSPLRMDQLRAVCAWLRLVIEYEAHYSTDMSVARVGWHTYWAKFASS